MSPDIERVGRIFGKSLGRVVRVAAHRMQRVDAKSTAVPTRAATLPRRASDWLVLIDGRGEIHSQTGARYRAPARADRFASSALRLLCSVGANRVVRRASEIGFDQVAQFARHFGRPAEP